MESRQTEERIITPNPALLITSLRDIGYSFVSAVADIIDNSISAHAEHIYIDSMWNSGKPFLAITDDGIGMSRDELVEAMRFGCRNPLDKRENEDLGRFGMGMKTASISQCRKLVVLSKKRKSMAIAIWDVDSIYEAISPQWALTVTQEIDGCNSPDLPPLFEQYLKNKSEGTIVLWEKMDRIGTADSSPNELEKSHTHQLALLKEHLELTFHRFLSPEPGRKKTHIYINDNPLEAFNPFNPKNITTVELPERKIHYDGEVITVQAYVLPHHNKVTAEEYKRYEGAEGYLNSQGFYVYRNKRLIIKGTWFRLIRRNELNKLIRIRVDIPNTLDHIWRIDIKKSNAELPEAIKADLKLIIERIQEAGKNVYRHKGYKVKEKILSPFWRRTDCDGQLSYTVNRENPLLERIMEALPEKLQNELGDYISMLESNFPRDHFFADMGESPEKMKKLDVDMTILFCLVDRLLDSNPEMSEKELLQTEPFCNYPEQIRGYLNEKRESGNDN